MGFSRHKRSDGTFTKERLLIYELLPNGDLYSRLQASQTKQNPFLWRERLGVAVDAFLGISHLHGSRPPVFHRDIKSQNILLDRNGGAKVADFGLACLAQPDTTALRVAQAAGTAGYADPEYIRTSIIDERAEVYSVGMVLLELYTGRPPAVQHPDGKVVMTYRHVKGNRDAIIGMQDRTANWPPAVGCRVVEIALTCIQDRKQNQEDFHVISHLSRNRK
mgnify:CR=1 FL=1